MFNHTMFDSLAYKRNHGLYEIVNGCTKTCKRFPFGLFIIIGAIRFIRNRLRKFAHINLRHLLNELAMLNPKLVINNPNFRGLDQFNTWLKHEGLNNFIFNLEIKLTISNLSFSLRRLGIQI